VLAAAAAPAVARPEPRKALWTWPHCPKALKKARVAIKVLELLVIACLHELLAFLAPLQHAISTPSASHQHAISKPSARNQHTISTQSARHQQAIRTQSARTQEAIRKQAERNQNAIRTQS
jgi:hypothetical protein